MKVSQINSASTIQSFEQSKQIKSETRTTNDQKDFEKESNDKFNSSDVKQAVDSLNGFIEPLYTNLKFVYHEELNEYYVTVINPLTDEVIKEIPPKKILDLYASMTESMGILIDEKI